MHVTLLYSTGLLHQCYTGVTLMYFRHGRALKKVTDLKKKAKKEFRKAQREGFPLDQVQSLARNIFNHVRNQSQLKKKSRQAVEYNSAKRARQDCYKNF